MQFAAIVERHLLHWYVYLPALDVGGPVPAPDDVHASAVALVTAAEDVPPQDVQIAVHVAVAADTVLQAPPTDVEVRHTDGAWRTARHVGWVRRRDGSWKSLVRYLADGAAWERAVPASCVRRLDSDAAAVPTARVSVESAGVDPFPHAAPSTA